MLRADYERTPPECPRVLEGGKKIHNCPGSWKVERKHSGKLPVTEPCDLTVQIFQVVIASKKLSNNTRLAMQRPQENI